MSDVDWLVGSVVVGDQGALDPGGQGGQPLGDPDSQAVDGVGAVAFQAELVFEGVEDGLNPLADPAQVAEPVRLITTVGTAQGGVQASHELVELPSRQPLVGQDDHARAQHPLAGGTVHQDLGRLALAELGVGQAPGHRHPVRAGQHIQLEPPVEAVMAGVNAVAGPAGQLAALDRLATGAAGDRGGVQQPPLVTPRRRANRQGAQEPRDQRRGPAQPAVVGGLAADVGEQVPQPAADGAQPAPFGVIAQQDLGDGQADEFGVRQLGWVAGPATGLQQLIDGDVECGDEVVETGMHEASPEVDVATATPTLGGLVSAVTPRHPQPNTTSVI